MVHRPMTWVLGTSESILSGSRAIGTLLWDPLSSRSLFPPRQPFRLRVGTQTANSHSTSQQAWVNRLSLKSPPIYSGGLASALTLSAAPPVSTQRSLQQRGQTRSFTESFPSTEPSLASPSQVWPPITGGRPGSSAEIVASLQTTIYRMGTLALIRTRERPNKSMETNSRRACPLAVNMRFAGSFSAQSPFTAAVAHLFR